MLFVITFCKNRYKIGQCSLIITVKNDHIVISVLDSIVKCYLV